MNRKKEYVVASYVLLLGWKETDFFVIVRLTLYVLFLIIGC